MARGLGVTQKTAWFMLHRIREAMKTGSFEKQFTGVVEADETFVGARHKTTEVKKNRKSAGPQANKTIVFGILERTTPERNSRVRAMVVPGTASH